MDGLNVHEGKSDQNGRNSLAQGRVFNVNKINADRSRDGSSEPSDSSFPAPSSIDMPADPQPVIHWG